MESGRVEGIFIAGEKKQLPLPVDRVLAVAGRGLEGNRHFYEQAPPGRALTLIAAEALAEGAAGSGVELSADESRRNVLTSRIDLNALVGERFRVGDVECVGVELCEPCATLEGMTRQGVIKAYVHRAGLNAGILTDGEIAVGDAVERM
ncbi:MAG: MOSC domain-containing protein [Actinomycetota bacterium]